MNTPPQPLRGFILQPTYRLEQGRPVVLLYGRLESGETFLVRDDRERPHFFVLQRDAGEVRRLGGELVEANSRELGTGEETVRVETSTPRQASQLRDQLHAAGIVTFEADVRFATRYLIDRGIRGSLSIEGESRPGEGVERVFDNPCLGPASWPLQPRTLSIDIETSLSARRLFSIALHGCGVSEVLLFTPKGYSCPPEARGFPHEKDLLRAFCQRVRELDPDVILGWNVVDFDLSVLAAMGERWQEPLELGRGGGLVHLQPSSGQRGWGSGSRVSIPGRVVLDGPQMLRGAFIPVEGLSLEAVARRFLGEGKLMTGHDRGREISHAFKHDRPTLVAYNRRDAELVTEILDHLGLIELAVQRSLLTGMPLDRVSASIASFDFLYLTALRHRQEGPRLVVPTVGAPGRSAEPHTSGGHVLEPLPGLYRNVVTFDFKSLYPSIIRTFQIDPVGYLPRPQPDDDPIVAPNGAAFRRSAGILPKLLDDLMPRREEARRQGDHVASQAIKILMNSFYGVLGTPACRFHNGALANAITSVGRELLLWCKGRCEELGFQVLYGDTDSLFVATGEAEAEAARQVAEELVSGLNRDLAAHVHATWRVESRLELELERLYLKLLLPALRGATGGARKRYAGWLEEDGERKVVFTGMEAVRRDWTDLAHIVQRELYERLFEEKSVDTYLRRVVAELRGGRYDDLLVYRKALRKRPEEYTSTSPPHVVAARRMRRRPGRLISYVMTEGGPEPAEGRKHPLDYEHYVSRQIRPIAEPVLNLLGLKFGQIIGDDRQMELF